MSYLLEKNSKPTYASGFPGSSSTYTHASALSRFKQMIGYKTIVTSDDDVKRVTSLGATARALDLYLALENAYNHYGDSKAGLLTASQVNQIEQNIIEAMLRAYKIADAWMIGGAGRTQAGNYPMKLFLGSAYAALGVRPVSYSGKNLSALMNDALNSAYNRHWNFQTGGGQRYWAEGAYYMNFALADVLPFWHVVRANNIQQNTQLSLQTAYRNISDPFTSNWFQKPLAWLADISTPVGETPPLDDGNKSTIYTASLLRWSSSYGRASTGKKFLTVYNNIPATSFVKTEGTAQRLIEIAIPRIATGAASLPDVKNQTASDKTEQQLVLRRNGGGRTHYVLLNGEHGNAISRGEGHEQPDNMQLLYYVNGKSVLMDSGYDKVKVSTGGALYIGLGTFVGSIIGGLFASQFADIVDWQRSTFNNYYDHNVLHWSYYHGGIPYPDLEYLEGGINSDHDDITHLYTTEHGNLSVLHAQQRLRIPLDNGQETFGYYGREVIFVGGSTPYLIDINRVTHSHTAYKPSKFVMSYHGNSSSFTSNNYYVTNGSFMRWNNIDGGSEDLHIHPLSIEYQLYNQEGDWRSMLASNDQTEEIFRDRINIKRLDISDFLKTNTTLATILQLRSSAPAYKPKRLWAYNGSRASNNPNKYQGWIWKQNANTLDVFMARSIGDGSPQAVIRNVNSADPSFPNLSLLLPANKQYGFARLVKDGSGKWNIDSNYQVNLTLAPLTVSIAGPACVDIGYTGTFNANASGGEPPYSYRWQKYQCSSINPLSTTTSGPTPMAPPPCTWITIDRSQSVDVRSSDSYQLKLTVTDAASTAKTTSHYVRVEPMCFPGALAAAGDSSAALATQQAGLQALSVQEAVPTAFALHANYPNPFNPQTEIAFDLPEATVVRLAVYDVLGREVQQLVNGPMEAGAHRVRFEAGHLPSGMYVYRLVAGSFTQSRRMVLMK